MKFLLVNNENSIKNDKLVLSSYQVMIKEP